MTTFSYNLRRGDLVRTRLGGPRVMEVVVPYTPTKPPSLFGITILGAMPPLGASGVYCKFYNDSGEFCSRHFPPGDLELIAPAREG